MKTISERICCIALIIAVILSFSCCSTTKEDHADKNTKVSAETEIIPGFDGTNWGFISLETGEFVIEPQFGAIEEFSNCGLAPVQLGEKWGYINTNGEFEIEPQFDIAEKFSKYGIAAVCSNGRWGYINSKGTMIIEPKFSETYRADYYANEDLSFINPDLTYVEIYDENNEIKMGVIDEYGNYIIQADTYSQIEKFAMNGLSAVAIDEKWGYMDLKGQLVIDAEYAYAGTFSSNGLAVASKDGKNYGYIDEKGRWIIDPIFSRAERFAENGLAAVELDGKKGYINRTGEMEIQIDNADYAFSFNPDDLAVVYVNMQCAVIDGTGRYVVEPAENRDVEVGIGQLSKSAFIWRKENDHEELLNSSGEIVFKPEREEGIWDFSPQNRIAAIIDENENIRIINADDMNEVFAILEKPFDNEDGVYCILQDYEKYTMLMYHKGEKPYKQMIFKDKKVFFDSDKC